MQVHLTALNIIDEKIIVSFHSVVGAATAHWSGNPPQNDMVYEVEIEVPGILNWGENIVEIEECPHSIFNDQDFTCIIGIIQSISDDGVVAVQIHNDLILLETIGSPQISPRFVLIKVRYITLFEVHL